MYTVLSAREAAEYHTAGVMCAKLMEHWTPGVHV
jgi:hypothetical protein